MPLSDEERQRIKDSMMTTEEFLNSFEPWSEEDADEVRRNIKEMREGFVGDKQARIIKLLEALVVSQRAILYGVTEMRLPPTKSDAKKQPDWQRIERIRGDLKKQHETYDEMLKNVLEGE